MTTIQKIQQIEDEASLLWHCSAYWSSQLTLSRVQMARTQKNKATSSHLGTLKASASTHRQSRTCCVLTLCNKQAKLAKLRRELLEPSTGSGGGGKGGQRCSPGCNCWYVHAVSLTRGCMQRAST